MRDLNIYLKKSIIKYNKLSNFGFSKAESGYLYKEPILDEEFEVQIFISKDKKYSKVIDVENNSEYALVDIEDAVGEFIGTVRSEYDKIINRFLTECTQKEVFKSKQAKELIKYIREKYGDELEFLWEKFDDNNADTTESKDMISAISEIKLENFSFQYGDRPILKNKNFTFSFYRITIIENIGDVNTIL